MGHVEFGEWRWIFELFLPVSQTKTKKRHLITVTFAALGFQVPRVVPPLSPEIRMGVVVAGKRKLSSWQRELIGKAGKHDETAHQRYDKYGSPITFTHPSPVKGDGKRKIGE